MSDLSIREPPTVLVPVEVLEGESISDSLAAFLAPANVVVLGYHVLPEQTPTEQASLQFEDRAQEAVSDLAAVFRAADGADVETRVAFTHDREQTVERVATEVGATAVLLPNPVGAVSDVVVPFRGAIDADRLADLVATLLADGEGTVTLWGIESDGFDAAATVERARSSLRERGLDAARITTETTAAESPIRDIVVRSADFDVIVMGEGDDSLWSALFGGESERVADGAVAPVLVVRDRETE
ncbi:nucleotide-binding universal stress UspA family protein [Halarchaeum solikamskense]|uniref:universal stress protein n=1 Tax=Halarchaeum nitratireducens TaxID=489913 RepID=UPI001B3B002F|nr:universal stress protein [Halarchaeum solikamskense]MBP2250518.1 nucleotide-binding universal stress UspA family protein [Halarchaeum solikamskense]